MSAVAKWVPQEAAVGRTIKSRRKTGQLRALGDDGNEYLIEEQTEFSRTQYSDGTWSEPEPGPTFLQLKSGERVFRRAGVGYGIEGRAVILQLLG